MTPMTETAKLEALIGRLRKRTERVHDLSGVSYNDDEDCHLAADAIETLTRALSVSRPAVKGLEWKELGVSRFWPKIWYGSGVFRANYKVEQSHPDGPWHSIGGNYPTPEAAKAAAQSDFEQRILSSLSPPTGEAEPLTFGYTNWRGEYAERTAIPLRIERKESEWHGPGLHYVLVAFDVEKQAERDFLLTDMGRTALTKKEGQ